MTMRTMIDGIEVIADDSLSKDKLKEYVSFAQANKCYPDARIESITINGSKMTIDFVQDKPKFARTARITGYLTGTVDRWNNAKKAELRDRVKHG